LSYRAAIRYEKEARLPLIRVPLLFACARSDMLYMYFDRVRELLPAHARSIVTEGVGSPDALSATVSAYDQFIDGLKR
jgi:hypothetical protein